MRIRFIDDKKDIRYGKLYLRSSYTTEAEEQIAYIIDALDDDDYENALDYVDDLIDIIKDCQRLHDTDLEEYEKNAGVDVDYKDFLPSDVSWKYTK